MSDVLWTKELHAKAWDLYRLLKKVPSAQPKLLEQVVLGAIPEIDRLQSEAERLRAERDEISCQEPGDDYWDWLELHDATFKASGVVDKMNHAFAAKEALQEIRRERDELRVERDAAVARLMNHDYNEGEQVANERRLQYVECVKKCNAAELELANSRRSEQELRTERDVVLAKLATRDSEQNLGWDAAEATRMSTSKQRRSASNPKQASYTNPLRNLVLSALHGHDIAPGKEERELAVMLFLGAEVEEPFSYAGWINSGEDGYGRPWEWRVLLRIAKLIALLKNKPV